MLKSVLGLNNVANSRPFVAPEPAHRLRIIGDDLVRLVVVALLI